MDELKPLFGGYRNSLSRAPVNKDEWAKVLSRWGTCLSYNVRLPSSDAGLSRICPLLSEVAKIVDPEMYKIMPPEEPCAHFNVQSRGDAYKLKVIQCEIEDMLINAALSHQEK